MNAKSTAGESSPVRASKGQGKNKTRRASSKSKAEHADGTMDPLSSLPIESKEVRAQIVESETPKVRRTRKPRTPAPSTSNEALETPDKPKKNPSPPRKRVNAKTTQEPSDPSQGLSELPIEVSASARGKPRRTRSRKLRTGLDNEKLPSAEDEQAKAPRLDVSAHDLSTQSVPASAQSIPRRTTSSLRDEDAPTQLPRFLELGLSAEIMSAVAELGYTHPTPIQARAIPGILAHRDVLGVAQTGTGKTASFTLPMLEMLAGSRARARMPRSLILEPTRELALQVSDNLRLYGKNLKLSYALLIGGESMADQRATLNQGVDILIATPGRLLDLFDRGDILLNQSRILVIDEADRMLDMGFIPDIQRIVSLLPRHRQTLFFSATMAPEIRSLADKFLHAPLEITISRPSSVATTIDEALIVVDDREKRNVLRKLLRRENVANAIIFCNRKRDVDMLHKSLQQHRFSVGHLHGDLTQSLRFQTLERFKAGEIKILVCSDVAARGIDIDGLSHVFNFDLPINAEDYVHRIGRTGRAGNTGHAYSLASPRQKNLVDAIEKLTCKSLPRPQIDGIPSIDWHDDDAPRAASAAHSTGATKSGGNANRRRADHKSAQYTDEKRRPIPQENRGRNAGQATQELGFGELTPAFMQRGFRLTNSPANQPPRSDEDI